MMVGEYQKKSLRDWFLSPPVQLLYGLALSNQMPNSVLCISAQLMLELRGSRIGITEPSCSLMMVKIKSISSPDGWTAKLN